MDQFTWGVLKLIQKNEKKEKIEESQEIFLHCSSNLSSTSTSTSASSVTFPPIFIGRNNFCQLKINDRRISSQHFCLYLEMNKQAEPVEETEAEEKVIKAPHLTSSSATSYQIFIKDMSSNASNSSILPLPPQISTSAIPLPLIPDNSSSSSANAASVVPLPPSSIPLQLSLVLPDSSNLPTPIQAPPNILDTHAKIPSKSPSVREIAQNINIIQDEKKKTIKSILMRKNCKESKEFSSNNHEVKIPKQEEKLEKNNQKNQIEPSIKIETLNKKEMNIKIEKVETINKDKVNNLNKENIKKEIQNSIQNSENSVDLDYYIKNNLIEKEYFEDVYILDELLGCGMMGKVFLCKKKNENNVIDEPSDDETNDNEYENDDINEELEDESENENTSNKELDAVKIINIKKLIINYKLTINSILQEVILIKKLKHNNIIKLKKIYRNESNTKLYYVIKYYREGDLFNKLVLFNKFNENLSKKIVYKILLGINYLHSKYIIHRDIKLENILVQYQEKKYNEINFEKKKRKKILKNVIITDFGLAKKNNNLSFNTFCGTPQYFAPEILKTRYSKPQKIDPKKKVTDSNDSYSFEADLWSIGVVTYILLSGTFPFEEDLLYEQIENGSYSFSNYEWKDISINAKKFIISLLQINPKERLTAKEALNHAWFQDIRKKSIKTNEENNSYFSIPPPIDLNLSSYPVIYNIDADDENIDSQDLTAIISEDLKKSSQLFKKDEKNFQPKVHHPQNQPLDFTSDNLDQIQITNNKILSNKFSIEDINEKNNPIVSFKKNGLSKMLTNYDKKKLQYSFTSMNEDEKHDLKRKRESLLINDNFEKDKKNNKSFSTLISIDQEISDVEIDKFSSDEENGHNNFVKKDKKRKKLSESDIKSAERLRSFFINTACSSTNQTTSATAASMDGPSNQK